MVNSCSEQKEKLLVNTDSIVLIEKKVQNLNDNEIKNWPINDIYIDTIPGISLLKANNELLKKRKGETIVVALIDMPLDVNHEKLKNYIWSNSDEVPENNIDDDGNGYVDDINGWNFLGNSDNENVVFMNYEYTRILRTHESLKRENKSNATIENQLERAKKAYEERMAYAKKALKNAKQSDSFYYGVKNVILPYLKEEDISVKKLDSLLQSNSENENLVNSIKTYKMLIDEEVDDAYINDAMLKAEKRLNVLLNLEYKNDLINSNPDELEGENYGNNNVSHNLELMNHATLMAGILVSNFGVNELDNVMSKIKIMPICVSGYGDENDKDIALAIRYAVDNGAGIINISSGKYFSLHENWVHDAIKYAAKNNVLIVTSSGNEGLNLDSSTSFKYPNDIDVSNNTEISNNFIRVGSSNYKLDSTLVHSSSNYGKTEVDIFAPGEEIYTTSAISEKYTFTSGTSASAAMVSKTAAIVKSYFPELTASQLKDIILKTGVKFNLQVKMKDSLGQKKLFPFNELSKSSKIVNLFNALKMAEIITEDSRN